MTRKVLTRAALAVCVTALVSMAPARAAGEELWLHVHVTAAEDGEEVQVNLPLQLVEAILPHISHEMLQQGKVSLAQVPELQNVDLRAIVAAIRDAADGEYVSVKSDKEHVRVVKHKDTLSVYVEDGEDRVRAEVPLELVTALVPEEGDEVDLLAALNVLKRYAGRELVTVESRNEQVRVWVDQRPAVE